MDQTTFSAMTLRYNTLYFLWSYLLQKSLTQIDKPSPPKGPARHEWKTEDSKELRWNAPENDGGAKITEYIVERREVGKKSWKQVGTTQAETTSIEIKVLKKDTSFDFRVSAKNNVGVSLPTIIEASIAQSQSQTALATSLSSTAVTAKPKSKPSAPRDLQIKAITSLSVTLQWIPPANNGGADLTGYIIEKRLATSHTWEKAATVETSITEYTVENLKEKCAYYFRVSAENEVGTGEAAATEKASLKTSAIQHTTIKRLSEESTLNLELPFGRNDLIEQLSTDERAGLSGEVSNNKSIGTKDGGFCKEDRSISTENMDGAETNVIVEATVYVEDNELKSEFAENETKDANEVPESPKDKKELAAEGDEIDIFPVDQENDDDEQFNPLLTTDIVVKSEDVVVIEMPGPESPKDKKGLAVEGDEIDINPVDLENNDAEESDPLLTTDIVLKSDEVVIEMADHEAPAEDDTKYFNKEAMEQDLLLEDSKNNKNTESAVDIRVKEGEPQDPTSLNMIDRKNDENVTATKAYVSSPVGPLRRCLDWVRSKLSSHNKKGSHEDEQGAEAIGLMEKENKAYTNSALCWSFINDDKGEVSGTRISFTEENAVVRTTRPVDLTSGYFYFEVELIRGLPDEYEDYWDIMIGLTTKETRQPGQDEDTVGYQSDTTEGQIGENGRTVIEASPLVHGDVIGCHIQSINVDNNIYMMYQVMKNGEYIGTRRDLNVCQVYPTVWARLPGLKIETNIGDRPFKFEPGNVKEATSILSWPQSNEEDFIQTDGLKMKSVECKWEKNATNYEIKTTQPIPRKIEPFEYSVRLIDGGDKNDIEITLNSEDDDLKYSSIDGSIKEGDKLHTSAKPFNTNDIVALKVRRVILGDNTYNIIDISLNGEKCCKSVILKGGDIYPGVTMRSSSTEIETRFGNARADANIEAQEKSQHLLSWPSRKAGNFIQSIDDCRIIAGVDSGKCSFMRTSKHIPEQWDSFHFEARITDGGDNFGIGVGFTTSLPEIGNGFPQDIDDKTIGVCLNTGEIWQGNKYIPAFDEKSSSEDVIGCEFSRIKIEDISYGICQFFRNGRNVGKVCVAEGNTYPCIWVASGKALIETNMGEGAFKYRKENQSELFKPLSFRSMGNILDVNEKKVAYQSDVTDEKDESQVPNTFYCEGTVLENSRHDSCGIGMKSNHATIVYHSGGGIFGGANGVINTGKPFETGDIIGCYVTLAVYKSNDEVYNLCSFYRNSEKSADSVIFEGSKLSAGLFLETLAADTCSGGGIIDLNVGDHAFLFKPDNQDHASSLLSWQENEQSSVKCNHGSQLVFEDKNLCSISTSQPIPEGIKSYGFEIELSKCSNNALIAFGMKSDVDEIRYWSKDGVVESNGDYIETIDTYDQGAVVRCHFRQINYAGTALQQCEFMCNEKNLGAWWIEGKHLRPTIWFDPMDEAFEMAEVKTKFDTNKQQCNLVAEEPASLLSWPQTKPESFLKCEGLRISSADTVPDKLPPPLFTTQPIPQKLPTFTFSAQIVQGGIMSNMYIGLKSEKERLTYFGDTGDIYFKGEQWLTAKPLTTNDVVVINLRRITVEQDTYNICHVCLNGAQYGGEIILEGLNLKPEITIISPGVKVETKFGNFCDNRNPEDELKSNSHSGKLQKKPLCHKDGSEVKVIKDEEDDSVSDNGIPKTFYFGTEIVEGRNMVVEIASDVDKIIYHNTIGKLLHIGQKTVTIVESLKEGDVLGCMLFLRTEEVEGKSYSTVQFLINSKIRGRSIRIEGDKLIPTVYQDNDNTKVKLTTEYTFNPEKCCKALRDCLPSLAAKDCCCSKEEESREQHCQPLCSCRSGSKCCKDKDSGDCNNEDSCSCLPCSQQKDKKKFCLTLVWNFLGLLLWPYFWYRNCTMQWQAPQDPQLLLINYILMFLLPLSDVTMDFINGASYEATNDTWFCIITISVCFLPFIVKLTMEIINTLKFAIRHKELFSKIRKTYLLEKTKQVITHLPFIQQFSIVPELLKISYLTDGPEAEEISLRMGSETNWEPFLEAAPQLCLQIYILIWKSFVELKEASPIQIISICSSILSISFASAGTFLLDRVQHPVSSNLKAKVFLALGFLLVFIPRAMTFATIALLFKNEYWKPIYIGGYILGGLVFIFLCVRLGSKIWSAEMPIIHQWNPEIKYADVPIKGEYEELKQHGYDGYISETRWKTIALSLFIPCIVIARKFRIFETSAVSSTLYHVFAAIVGLVVCEQGYDMCKYQTNNQTMSSNDTSALPIPKEELLTWIFSINLGILIVSGLMLALLSRLTDMFRLRRAMFGHFEHPCMAAMSIEKEARLEYNMEAEAKKLSPAWQAQLNGLKNKEMAGMQWNHESNLLQISNTDVDLNNAIIIRRQSKRTIMEKPVNMVKTLRFGHEQLGLILTNMYLHKMKKESVAESVGLHEQQPDIHDVIQKKNLNELYKLLQNIQNVDVKDDRGDTPLMTAIKKQDCLAAKLLLLEGCSIMLTNCDKKNVFEIALSKGSEDIKRMLLTHMKKQGEIYEIFFKLCWNGDLNGNNYCLENLNNVERINLIQFNQNEQKLFPLLHCIIWHQEEVALLLVKQHKQLNETFLLECNANNTNALMLASQVGLIKVVKELIDIYQTHNKITDSNNVGVNALMAAAYGGHEEIVRLLLPFYKDKMNEKDKNGRTALDIARIQNHEDIVNLLQPL